MIEPVKQWEEKYLVWHINKQARFLPGLFIYINIFRLLKLGTGDSLVISWPFNEDN